MSYNILCCSVGRRNRMMNNIRMTLGDRGLVVGVDHSSVAPALYTVDKPYIVPQITDPGYVDKLLTICKNENIRAITTFIDPEIEVLSNARERFKANGILPLCPSPQTAHLCYDKYELYKYMKAKGVRTVLTYHSLDSFYEGVSKNEINFPVFVKPISGSGSVGAQKVDTKENLELLFKDSDSRYIIQELMTGEDCDADVYVDCISHRVVSAFAKRKIEKRIGGASKTVSFKDQKLFDFIELVCSQLELSGPCDMDFFYRDGEYYLLEINPRFGGAYLHAYGAGVDFIKLIMNNMDGRENEPRIGDYEEGVLMLMYDDVVITTEKEWSNNSNK